MTIVVFRFSFPLAFEKNYHWKKYISVKSTHIYYPVISKDENDSCTALSSLRPIWIVRRIYDEINTRSIEFLHYECPMLVGK